MSLLKQDLSHTVTTLPAPSKQSIFDTYDSIGQDLHSLLQDWQSGRTDLIQLLQENTHEGGEGDTQTEGTVVEEGMSVADSGLGISVASLRDDTLAGGRSKRDSCGDWGVAFASPRVEEMGDIFEESPQPAVLIGTAVGKHGSRTGGGGGGTGRTERIERAKREREEVEARKRAREESSRWVGELKDVLGRRGR